jgi:VWFA-related protein
VKKEAETAQKGAYVQFVSRSDAIQKQLQVVVGASGIAPPTQGQGGASFGASMVEAKMAEMQLNALQMAESLERDYFMRSTLNSLLALVRSQASLPGRKMMVYFTEQFAVPDHLVELFRTLMSESNRANVSIYTVDAKGLSTWNQSRVGQDLVTSAAGSSESVQTADSGAPVRRDQVMVFDTAIEGLRSNVQSQLSELAANTGGFMIANTNDLKAPLRKTLEELRTYYEAVYVPQIGVYDGKFRKLTVRVTRPEMTVQTRNGYYALPRLGGGQQLYAYEMPLLNALSASPLPKDLEFLASAGRFDPRGEAVQLSLMIEIPMKGLEFKTDPVKKTAFTRTSLMALFKDEHGEVVQKFSRDFPVQVPIDKVEGYRAGNLTQMYPLRLPPGRYTLETAVVDRNTDKLAAQRAVVVVPAPGKALSISDITMVRRVEPMKEEPDPANPFQSAGGRVTPTLNNTAASAPGAQLSFYFVVYPEEGNSTLPDLTMAFFSGGQPLGEGKPELPKPDKHGRICYIASVPAEQFPAGEYQMKAIVKQGASTAEEDISFTVQ